LGDKLSAVFYPQGTAKIAATSTTSSATLPIVGNNVIVYNAGTNLVYVKFGGSSITATVPTTAGTGSTPIPPGFYGAIISRSPDIETHVAAICDAGNSTNVYFSCGNGT